LPSGLHGENDGERPRLPIEEGSDTVTPHLVAARRPRRHGGRLALTGAAAASPGAAQAAAAVPDFGPNVTIFDPSMSTSAIKATVDAIAAQQVPDQFGSNRFALLFMPGRYGSAADPLNFNVGYYTEVVGLGALPTDVTVTGTIDVHNQCSGPGDCTALVNFWRSLST
jgi:hypothetical protein